MQDASTYSIFFGICLMLACSLPFLSFIISFIISDNYSWIVSFTAPFLLLLSTLSAAFVFFSLQNGASYSNELTWFVIGDAAVTAGLLIDNLSSTMLLVVTFISLLVHVYSIGYMAGDSGIRRYFAMLGLFTFSMMGIVLSNNLLLLFVFWELVGFSSYMLIGHWKEKPEAAQAAKKAFIINRIGDAGFLVGLMILWTYQGSFDILELNSMAPISSWQTAASLCIFCGVVGKSAQFPLLIWLPDAMEGPTPVSALIHAATMVAAGVFLMIRVFVLFTPTSLDVVAIVGILTALIGAFAALGQYDIKKILAYSTISQLGLMITALGAGAPDAAFVHLFTHAFFKACLFLAAGSIIHSLHQAQQQAHIHFDVQDIRNLGGLRKKLPTLFITFIIAGSSLAGLPFFSGFLSKDAILTAILAWKNGALSWEWFVGGGAFLVSFLTVLYSFRMIWSVFFGEEKETKRLIISEPPIVMQFPVFILAAASFWIIISGNPFINTRWVTPGLHHNWNVTLFSAAWVLSACAVAYATRNKRVQLEALTQSFYLNELYQVILKRSTWRLALLTSYVDKKWIDGFIHASAYAQLLVAHVAGWMDYALVDGAVNGVASLTRRVGSVMRSFQDGKIQLYIFWSLFTVIIFIIWTIL